MAKFTRPIINSEANYRLLYSSVGSIRVRLPAIESIYTVALSLKVQIRENRACKNLRHWFKKFTEWNFLPNNAPPKFTGARPLEALGPRMITLVTAQELELRLGKSADLTHWIDRCIHEIRTESVFSCRGRC